jgi:methylthioribose-1-phosphate isomerase
MAKTLYWKKGRLHILDQRLLPARIRYISCRRHTAVADAIRDMAVRGAPAIGVTAAFGVALAAAERKFASPAALKKHLSRAIDRLAATRPTAVNLFWALERMRGIVTAHDGSAAELRRRLLDEALEIYEHDCAVNRKIGDNGARLLRRSSSVLTHCNAGALATAGYGTALGVIRSGHARGKIGMVFVDESRPYLQGARLTAWEMKQERIPYVLITDNMAGYFMSKGLIDAVIVGADRIAANGDTANKIGTYSLAVLARHHRIPFYVAAPLSTVDAATASGKDIVIEERSAQEVLCIHGRSIAPKGTIARHPAFDVTPAKYITAIITETGVFAPRDIKKAILKKMKGV